MFRKRRPQIPQVHPQPSDEVDRGLVELARWWALPPLDIPGYTQRDIQTGLTRDNGERVR